MKITLFSYFLIESVIGRHKISYRSRGWLGRNCIWKRKHLETISLLVTEVRKIHSTLFGSNGATTLELSICASIV